MTKRKRRNRTRQRVRTHARGARFFTFAHARTHAAAHAHARAPLHLPRAHTCTRTARARTRGVAILHCTFSSLRLRAALPATYSPCLPSPSNKCLSVRLDDVGWFPLALWLRVASCTWFFVAHVCIVWHSYRFHCWPLVFARSCLLRFLLLTWYGGVCGVRAHDMP